MKKRMYPSVFLLFLSLKCLSQAHTFEAKDQSKQVNVPNNMGTVNINNYLSKSDDYKALTKQFDDLNKEIKDKKEDCAYFEAEKSERLDKCNQNLASLIGKRDSMKNIIGQFKEDILRLAELMREKNIDEKDRLLLKYPYGYVLMGAIKGVVIYDVELNAADPRITADWKKTILKINSDSTSFDIKIPNLKWIVEDKDNNNSVNINIGQFNHPKVIIPAIGKEVQVMNLVYDNVNVYFELLENVQKPNFQFVLGFKK